MRYGFEKEYFVVQHNNFVLADRLPRDECGYLAECRGTPLDDPLEAAYVFQAAEKKLKSLASSQGFELLGSKRESRGRTKHNLHSRRLFLRRSMMPTIYFDRQSYRLDEAYPNGVRMALLNGVGTSDIFEQAGPFTTCRDFFADAIRASINGYCGRIYGYPCGDRIDLSGTRFVVTDVRVRPTVELVQRVEEYLGIAPLTQGYEAYEGKNPFGFVSLTPFIGPAIWNSAPQLLSLYTWLLRNGSQHRNSWQDTLSKIAAGRYEPGCPNDAKYAPFIIRAIDYIAANGIDNIFGIFTRKNYPLGEKKRWGIFKTRGDDKYFHENSGIISFMYNDGKEMFPHYRYPAPVTEEKQEWLHN